MHPLIAPAMAEIAIITWRDIRKKSNVDNPIPHFPLPSQFVSVAIVFGGLSLLPESAATLAAVTAWGVVVATALNAFTPGNTVNTAKVSTSATTG